MTQTTPTIKLSVSEAAEYLHVTPGRVRQFIADGRLPATPRRVRHTARGVFPHEYWIAESDVIRLSKAPRLIGGSKPEVPFELFVPYLRRRLRRDPTLSIRELHAACRAGVPVRRRGAKEPELVKYPRRYSRFRDELAKRSLRPPGYAWRGGWHWGGGGAHAA